MIIPLVIHQDGIGVQWRLALDDTAGGGQPIVVLERSEIVLGESAWVHIKIVTTEPVDAGVMSRGRGVVMLDDRRCRVVLEDELGKLGVEKTPAQPETPRVPGHNVLQLAAELEAMHTASTDDAGRKLREAFYLLQDVTHLVTVFKSALVGPPPDMLSSWIEVILHRCSLFPSIKVPR